MEFTNRQIFIISYLLDNADGMNANYLANKTNISISTLQREIRDINKNLQDDAVIINVGNHGYAARNFSKALREKILAESEQSKTILMPEKNINDILSALLFEKDYISIDFLADKLHLSGDLILSTIDSFGFLKTIVSINPDNKLKINLTEFEKRQYLINAFDERAAILYAPEVGAAYRRLDILIRNFLPELFIKYDNHVSGEAIRGFHKYLILSIIRNNLGYKLEDIDHKLVLSDLMNAILDITYSVTGFKFSDSDKQDLQAKLNELPTFKIDIPENRRLVSDWEPSFTNFIDNIKKYFNIDLQMTDTDKQKFLQHVYKLYQRIRIRHSTDNSYVREINRTYPLATQLVAACFEMSFGFVVPESEITFLALYLELSLKKYHKDIDCKIVTSKHPGMVWSMEEWLEEHFGQEIHSIEIIEHYVWDRNRQNTEYMDSLENTLIITSIPSIALTCPSVVLVRPFALDSDYDLIKDRIKELIKTKSQKVYKDALAKYVEYHLVSDDSIKGVPNLKELLKHIDYDASLITDEGNYEFILDTDVFWVPHIYFDKDVSDKNRIELYYLKESIFYRGVRVKTIVISRYFTPTDEMVKFYECIKEILKPGQAEDLKLLNMP